MTFKFSMSFEHIEKKERLSYIIDDYAFEIEPIIYKNCYNLVINYIDLPVDKNDCIFYASGFCPYGTWIKQDYQVPPYSEGRLKVEINEEPGFSYRINDDQEWPIYINEDKWVCIGNPNKSESAVEFANNCVAVIDQGSLVALWLKPDFVGDFEKIKNFQSQQKK